MKGAGNRTGVAASVALLRRIRVQIALCLFGDGKGVLGHVELEACELWGVLSGMKIEGDLEEY